VALADTTSRAAGHYQTANKAAVQDSIIALKEGTLTNSAGLASALSDETGTGVAVFSASPTLTGTVGAAAITATGTITGAMGITLHTVNTEITLTAQQCRNQAHINNDADAVNFTLPTAEAGLVVLFYGFTTGVITVDSNTGDIITLDGTALDAGDAIDSPGAVGNFIALMAIDATNWVSVGRSGTWVDGGTD
jgi:hypothetical protein